MLPVKGVEATQRALLVDPSLEAEPLTDALAKHVPHKEDNAGRYDRDDVGTKRYYAPKSWVSAEITQLEPTDALGFQVPDQRAPHVVSVGWERVYGMHNLRHVYVYGPNPAFSFDPNVPESAPLATHFAAAQHLDCAVFVATATITS